jgi:uncharacterized membrane protein
MEKRWLIAGGLLAGSLLMSAIFWVLGLPFFFAFLFIPFIPFFKKTRARRCPECGWETTGSERFCPYDATPLSGSESGK